MIRVQIYISFQLLFVSSILAQNEIPRINYTDTIPIKLFVIGEGHYDDNRFLQQKVLNDLLEANKINQVLMEWPLGADEIFNRYVLFNDSTYLPQIESFVHKNVAKNSHHILNEIRKHNSAVSTDCKVSITTIDYLGYQYLSYNLNFLSIIFPQLNS